MQYRRLFLLLLTSFVLVACGGGGGSAPTSDTIAPTVKSVGPTNTNVNVDINSTISAIFSEAIDANSINQGSFYVSDSNSNIINGNITSNVDTITFTPSNELSHSTSYTVTITTAVKDTSGNNISSEYVWSFTTKPNPDAVPPTITSVTPNENATDITVDSVVTINFSEAVKSSTINQSTFLFQDKNGATVNGVMFIDQSGLNATFVPDNNLNHSSSYTITITTGLQDLAGNALANNKVWSFTTRDLAFNLAPDKSSFSTIQGGTASLIMEVDVTSGIYSDVSLSISGCPAFSRCYVNPDPVTEFIPGSTNGYASINVVTASNTPPGIVNLTVTGTSSGTTVSTVINLDITAQPGSGSPYNAWGSEGVPVTIAPYSQRRSASIPDGVGGVYIAWDHPVADSLGVLTREVYIQRLNSSGEVLFGSDGVNILNSADVYNAFYGIRASASDVSIISDGSGGAIISWTDLRRGKRDIYAQRIDSLGNILWQKNGIAVSVTCSPLACFNSKNNPQMISDGAGGAFFAWSELRDGTTSTSWTQHVRSDGTLAWDVDGLQIPTASGATIVSDQAGGFFVIWGNPVSSSAQRVDANGNFLWPPGGIVITPDGKFASSIISDGSGGAIFAMQNGVDGDIYAQKLDANGQLQWDPGGVTICTRSGLQKNHVIVSDGAGGAFIAWEDQGVSPSGSGQQLIFAQYVNTLGAVQWVTDGIQISSTHDFEPQMASDDNGGFFITWSGFGNQPSVLAQHVSPSGQKWPNGEHVVYTINGNYGFSPKINRDGTGGVIIHWLDYRLSSQDHKDYFAQRVVESP